MTDRRHRIVLVATALIGLLAACGSDSDTGAPATDGAEVVAPAESTEPTAPATTAASIVVTTEVGTPPKGIPDVLVDRWVGRVREPETTVRDHPDAHAARLGEREPLDLAAVRLHRRRRTLLAERLDVLAALGRFDRGGAQIQQVRHRCLRP